MQLQKICNSLSLFQKILKEPVAADKSGCWVYNLQQTRFLKNLQMLD